MKKKNILLLITFSAMTSCALGQNNAPLSSNAPKDKPISIVSSEQTKKIDAQIAPYVEKAKKTLPDAKKRFMKGLGQGEAFFLTTRIFDKDGKFEQVFIRVKSWEGENITGTIANPLYTVKEYKSGQTISMTTKNILDWLITKPDGTEEGNFVGNYLDSVH